MISGSVEAPEINFLFCFPLQQCLGALGCRSSKAGAPGPQPQIPTSTSKLREGSGKENNDSMMTNAKLASLGLVTASPCSTRGIHQVADGHSLWQCYRGMV